MKHISIVSGQWQRADAQPLGNSARRFLLQWRKEENRYRSYTYICIITATVVEEKCSLSNFKGTPDGINAARLTLTCSYICIHTYVFVYLYLYSHTYNIYLCKHKWMCMWGFPRRAVPTGNSLLRCAVRLRVFRYCFLSLDTASRYRVQMGNRLCVYICRCVDMCIIYIYILFVFP